MKSTPATSAADMLKDRILFTLKFFDLQQTPLTLGQLRNFLLNEPAVFQSGLTPAFEFAKPPPVPAAVSTDEIRQALVELSSQVQQQEGLLALAGRTELIREYGRNLKYRDHREALIRKFVPRLQLVPFVRGVGVGGSHTLGFPKPESDIDLLIILDPEFLFLGRLLVTLYFQLTGYRRHGAKIRDRFCLNH